MPHLRPLLAIIDPRSSSVDRRRARRRLSTYLRNLTHGSQSSRDLREGARTLIQVPASWQDIEPIDDAARWCVVLHGDAGDAAQALEVAMAVTEPFDAFVISDCAPLDHLSDTCNIRVLPTISGGFPHSIASLVNAGLLDPYDVIWCHSTGQGIGLTAARSVVTDGPEIIEAFRAQDSLGIAVMSDLSSARVSDRRSRDVLRRFELEPHDAAIEIPRSLDGWYRGFVLQGLRGLHFRTADFARGNHDEETFRRVVATLTVEAGCEIMQVSSVQSRRGRGHHVARRRPRVVPFYLPQFHPIPENNEWWGDGFTEWTNTSTAKPVFPGHDQPKHPGELGYYDLRLDEVRERQAALASIHGVAGFMYYHYWFAGHPLLDLPIHRLAASDIELPFCLMWANENWTRSWDGGAAHVLIAQEHEDVAPAEFIDAVLPFLHDPRYLRVNGHAVIAVYRLSQFPDVDKTIEAWRSKAAEQGLELFILAVDAPTYFEPEAECTEGVIDGRLGFPPHRHRYSPSTLKGVRPYRAFVGNLMSYQAMAEEAERQLSAGIADSYFPGVMTGFDNTARRQWQADVWLGANPYTFRRWLRTAVAAVADRPEDARIVFVNAWNEWAEGAVLEPTARFGRTYLLAVRDVVGREVNREWRKC